MGNGNGDRALKAEVEKEAAVPTYSPEDLGLTPLKKRDKLRQGEKLVVCSGSQIGLEGEVLSVSRGILHVIPGIQDAPDSGRWTFKVRFRAVISQWVT